MNHILLSRAAVRWVRLMRWARRVHWVRSHPDFRSERFRPFRVKIAAAILATTSALGSAMAASTCPFDTGGSDAINDGLVLTRYALGITGTPMIASTRYASLDPLQVKANIECVGCALDMNGDNQIDTVDTTIIARHLMGFTSASLTDGLALGAGSRNSPAAVTSFLANGCAVGGAINAFVQGGNAFGAPAVLGTNDAQPLTLKTGGTDIKVVNLRGDGTRVTYMVDSPNTVNGHFGNAAYFGVNGVTIGGGGGDGASEKNLVTGNYGTVAGGLANIASGSAVVSGGYLNSAGGGYSVISGGSNNSIALGADVSSITGGNNNIASGTGSTVAGGSFNVASGHYSFAAGSGAHADKVGAFVWADNYGNAPFKVTLNWQQPTYGANTFNVRATGGVMFVTSVSFPTGVPATYCYMGQSGTGWICASDRKVKERVEPITPSRVLAGVLAMPVSTWSIIGSKVRQMGPMAQDFYRAFGLGDTDKAINSIDVGGVAFAAIQGLNQKLADEVKSLRSRLVAKDEEAARLKVRLAAIEKKLGM